MRHNAILVAALLAIICHPAGAQSDAVDLAVTGIVIGELCVGTDNTVTATVNNRSRVDIDGPIDLLLTDLRLGGPDGIDLFQSLKVREPDLEAILLTAYGTVDDAVRTMRAGAYDFVMKPVDLGHLEARGC